MPPPPATGHRAVFLSSALEDAGAAGRLAGALRAAGLEVWCDQYERRDRSSWDDGLRVRVDTCALFVAVLSAHTDAQPEAYFRKEWRLAAERTQRMAAGRGFLLPVVVDDLVTETALAPVEFRAAPWTHLPGGVATPAFLETLRGLLDMAGLERLARVDRCDHGRGGAGAYRHDLVATGDPHERAARERRAGPASRQVDRGAAL